MARTRNAALAARVAELGLTEAELADQINDAVEVLTGRRGRATDRYVRMLLTGEIRWPWSTTRKALEQALSASAAELGFVPHRRTSSSSAAGAPATRAAGADVSERWEIGPVGGGGPVLEVPALPRLGRLLVGDVHRQREPLVRLADIDAREGGVGLAPVAVRLAERLLAAIGRLHATDLVQQQFYALAGESLTTAAWCALDAGDLRGALGLLNRARWMAAMSRDWQLEAHIMHVTVAHLGQAGHDMYGYGAARAGLRTTAARLAPKVAALFRVHLAHAHAVRGEIRFAEQSLDKARSALGKVAGDTPDLYWLRWLDGAGVDAAAGEVWKALGRYSIAAMHLRRALATMPAERVRDRALTTLTLAELYLSRHEVGSAAAHADAALELAGQMRDGLTSGRVAARLRRLHQRFVQRADDDQACAWIKAYQAAVPREVGAGPDGEVAR